MPELKYLFSPGRIGAVELKNRIIFAPMLDRFANEDGSISEASVRYYRERARGGAALLIVGAVNFLPEAHYRPHQTCLYDDSFIDSHRRLTDAIHEAGALVSCQLIHAGIRLSQKAFGAGSATRPVGPSAIPFATTDTVPHALSIEEIHAMTEAFAAAARRAREAGYDVVDILAAHGYLLHSFLSPYSNRRDDSYGGSNENRARFLCEVIRGIKREAGSGFPIQVRINGTDFLGGGIDIEQARVHARLIEKAGANAINVSSGTRESRQYTAAGYHFSQTLAAELSEKVKAVVRIPVSTVGRYTDPIRAEEVLAKGQADFVLMARALLADPEWPNKAREGRLHEIRPCIGDNTGCVARDIRKFPTVSCTVNATIGHEEEFRIRRAATPRSVLVVGSGPAGMEAARVAAMRGHRVSLYERETRLGGQLDVASRPPNNHPIQRLSEYLIGQIGGLGVEIHTGVTVTPQLVAEKNPDVVVVATGSNPILPDVPGLGHNHVVLAADVLEKKVKTGQRVVVIGGGLVGMDTSLVLAQEGKQVILVEMLPRIGANANVFELLFLMERFIDLGVQVLTNTKLLSIHPGGVTVVMTELTSENEVIFIRADTVVMAIGYRASQDLAQELEKSGRPIYVIGDCREPRKIIDAIHEGFQVGLEI